MLAYVAMSGPLWGGVLLWYVFVSRTEEVLGLLGFTFTVCLVVAWWFSRITAHHMAIEGQSFKPAFQNTFYPVIMKLAFLPGIGSYFARLLEKKKGDPFREKPK